MDLRRYERRLSGPLLDRMDMLVNVDRPSEEELRGPAVTDSARPATGLPTRASASGAACRARAASCNGELDAGLIQSRVQAGRRGAGDARGRIPERLACRRVAGIACCAWRRRSPIWTGATVWAVADVLMALTCASAGQGVEPAAANGGL